MAQFAHVGPQVQSFRTEEHRLDSLAAQHSDGVARAGTQRQGVYAVQLEPRC